MREKKLYTTGELAKLTGVSYKTIRHYYENGLLIPEKIDDNGYKKFGNIAVEQLQKILMLKYLDFSLEEIREMLEQEEPTEVFARQAELLRKQKAHLELVLQAVEEIQNLKEELAKQYAGSDNLQKRINIHVYSTSKVPWFAWVKEGLELKSGMKILELGCGTGALWISQRESLPENLEILLTDKSEGMLEATKAGIGQFQEYYASKNIRFRFLQMAAEDFVAMEEKYDRIIANHMLYHVPVDKRQELLENCAKSLKKEGMFYASTIGTAHNKELYELAREFDERIDVPRWTTDSFELENGKEQLQKVFHQVSMEEIVNDLLVPDPSAVYYYVESWPGNAKNILAERGQEFCKFLEERISPETPFFCHKSTGAFRAYIS